MNLTKDEAIIEVCSITSLIFHSIGNYSKPNDGFCIRCPNSNKPEYYQNSGEVIGILREAALDWLNKKGFKVADGFDSITGKEVK